MIDLMTECEVEGTIFSNKTTCKFGPKDKFYCRHSFKYDQLPKIFGRNNVCKQTVQYSMKTKVVCKKKFRIVVKNQILCVDWSGHGTKKIPSSFLCGPPCL